MKTLAIVLCVLSTAVPSFAQTFTLDAALNCPGLGYGANYVLLSKTYYIQYDSGAWSPYADDSYSGGYTWESRVGWYDYNTAQSGFIGAPANPGFYQTPQEAEAAAQGVYPLTGHGSVVSFYLYEVTNPFNDCSDNRGSVTLTFVIPTSVGGNGNQVTTWGAIKALYQ